MDGVLPSVVGGLVRQPVIAVPTSRGYGAHFGGLAALLTMLNSCAAGVGVMNIDNGFGAGCMAHRINMVGELDGRLLQARKIESATFPRPASGPFEKPFRCPRKNVMRESGELYRTPAGWSKRVV